MFSVLRISASIVCGLIMASMVASQSGCSIPKSRKNLITYFQVTNEIVDPGEVIPDSGLVEFNCTSGYNLIGRKTTYCSGSSWAHTIPRCSKFCPKPTAAVSTVVTCEYKNAVVDKCSEGYDLPSPSTKDVIVCREDGKWNSPQFSCVENCGYVSDPFTSFIHGGATTNVPEVSWQFKHMVISAAHCFWDEANLKPFWEDNYKIAAGKLFSKYSYNEKEDGTSVQYMDGLCKYWPDSEPKSFNLASQNSGCPSLSHPSRVGLVGVAFVSHKSYHKVLYGRDPLRLCEHGLLHTESYSVEFSSRCRYRANTRRSYRY